MIVSFILQAVALHFGQLSQVQPILTLSWCSWWPYSRSGSDSRWPPRMAWLAGVRGRTRRVPVLRPPRGGHLAASFWSWVIAGAACSAGIAVAVVLALRGPRWWRAAMFGTAGAISFAFTAACTKVVSIRRPGLDVALPARADLCPVLRCPGRVLDPERLSRRTDRGLPVDARHGRPLGQHPHRRQDCSATISAPAARGDPLRPSPSSSCSSVRSPWRTPRSSAA